MVVALVGLLRALRGQDAPLAAGCGAAFLAHGLLMATRPLAGGSWGPRDWTDALPVAVLFLPEGLDVLRGAGTALAFLSVAVQLLGAFTYDGRWDRLFAPTPEKRTAVLWDAAQSPIPFQIAERVWILALPEVHAGKVRVAEHRIVLGGPRARESPRRRRGSSSKEPTRPSGTYTFRAGRASRASAFAWSHRAMRSSFASATRAASVSSRSGSPVAVREPWPWAKPPSGTPRHGFASAR
jgi:hypothetical protein